MYDVVILTTAVTRPTIHVKALGTLRAFLTRNINILWIINIDFVNIHHKFIPDDKITDKVKEQYLYNTAINIKALSLSLKYSNTS